MSYVITKNREFSTESVSFPQKYALKHVLNAIINITLFIIEFSTIVDLMILRVWKTCGISVRNLMQIVLLNVLNSCDLGEHYIIKA